MNASPFLIIEKRALACGAPWLTWQIRRPERGNAVGPTVAGAMLEALAALELEAATAHGPRVVVLSAEPVVKGARRTWIAGGDLKELQAEPTKAQGERYAGRLSAFMTRLDALPVPVVVAVDGDAIGGGSEIALGGDVRLATRASRWIFKQLEVGLATGYGGARRLVELVGLSRAQDLLFGGRTVGAEEALAMGLVHEVLADDAALAKRVEERVTQMAALSRESLATQKQMLWHAVRSHPGAARDAELALFKELWGNPRHRELLAAFGKKP